MYSIASAMSYLPIVELAVTPRIAFTKNAVVVFGHRGICKYTENEICVLTGVGPLLIQGKRLRLSKIDRASISVAGVVFGISFGGQR